MQAVKVKGFDKLFPTLITLDIHEDHRGSFAELWRHTPDNIEFNPIQSNLSRNTSKGTFRGLHFQTFFPQKKLIQVISGRIVDFVVDVRPKSATFGKYALFWLHPGNALLVPGGFAHGFLTLEDNTVVNYLVDGYRFPEHERIVNPLDGEIDHVVDGSSIIDALLDILEPLGMDLRHMIMSDKDKFAPALEEIDYNDLKFAAPIGDLTNR